MFALWTIRTEEQLGLCTSGRSSFHLPGLVLQHMGFLHPDGWQYRRCGLMQMATECFNAAIWPLFAHILTCAPANAVQGVSATGFYWPCDLSRAFKTLLLSVAESTARSVRHRQAQRGPENQIWRNAGLWENKDTLCHCHCQGNDWVTDMLRSFFFHL